MRAAQKIFIHNDRILMLCYFLLLFIGCLSIYGIEKNLHPDMEFWSLSNQSFKQFFWVIFSFVMILLLLYFLKNFQNYSYLFYFLGIALLLGLFLFGKNINGATSWYQLGGFSFQPSEFAKFTTSMGLAYFISRPDNIFELFFGKFIAFCMVLFPMLLIILQNDMGSAIIFIGFIFGLYRENVHKIILIAPAAVMLLFIIYLFFGFWQSGFIAVLGASLFFIFFRRLYYKISFLLKRFLFTIFLAFCILKAIDYAYVNIFENRHRNRFEILTGKIKDTKGIGYNLNQSLIAIRSGNFLGMGFLKGGHTKGNFIPEQHTDYIFSYICEEFGFVGGGVVILIYTLLIFRIIQLSNNQKRSYNRIYGYALAGILSLHYFINIGMVCGILPTIGIPLPLISYGGSSIFSFSFFLLSFAKIIRESK